MRRGLERRAAAGGLAGLFLSWNYPNYNIKNYLATITPWGGD